MGFFNKALNIGTLGLVGQGPLSGTPQQQQSYLNPEQNKFLTDLYQRAGSWMSQNPSAQIAPQSPFTTQGQNMALNFAGGMAPGIFGQSAMGFGSLASGAPYSYLGGLGGRANQALSSALSPSTPSYQAPGMAFPEQAINRMLSGQVNADPYNAMFDAASRRVTDAFNQNVLPGINRSFQSAGRYGSPKNQLAVGQAANTLQQNLSDMAANMYGGAYQQAQNMMGQGAQLASGNVLAGANLGMDVNRLNEQARQFGQGNALNAAQMYGGQLGQMANTQLGALNYAPQLMSLGLMPSQIYGDIGSQQQAYQQQRLDAPFTQLSRYSGLLGQPTVLNQSTGAKPGFLENFATLGQGLGGFGKFAFGG